MGNRGPEARLQRQAWTLIAIVSVCVYAGCQRDVDTARAALAVRQASWERELGTLKAQQAALAQRFGGIGPGSVGPAGPSAAQLRLRALLDGAGQSLVDVEMQMQQIAPRLDQAAAANGGEAAQKLLEDESRQMSEYIQSLTSQMTAAGREVDALEGNQRGQDRPKVTQNQ